MPIVDFFLDEEVTPMPLCVVHDADGPHELEVLLGTFSSTSDAMSAVDTVRQFLQEDKMRWANVVEALNAAQFIALRCRGNHGLLAEIANAAEAVGRGVDDDLAERVIGSPTFVAQRERAHRVTLSDQQVASLLRNLVAAAGHRIDPRAAATALGIPVVQLGGALPMVQRLLNVEQYPVLERDGDGVTIVLNLALLIEQFGVSQ